MRARAVVLATATLLGLLAGCSGGSDPGEPSPAPTVAEQSSAASPSASSPSSAPASPSASSAVPSSAGQEITAADGMLTWTMPCDPEQEDIDGNEEDKKTYRNYQAWRCGDRGSATSGAFVLELVRKPADTDAARQAMRTALTQLAPKSKPTANEVAGQPGITATAELNGKEFGFQVISFDSYLALFIATPVEELSTITSTVEVN